MQTATETVRGIESGFRAYRSTDAKTWEVGPTHPVSDMDREHIARGVPTRELARMFAAAPDLLEAVEGLLKHMDMSKVTVRNNFSLMVAHNAARKAVDKARGIRHVPELADAATA